MADAKVIIAMSPAELDTLCELAEKEGVSPNALARRFLRSHLALMKAAKR